MCCVNGAAVALQSVISGDSTWTVRGCYCSSPSCVGGQYRTMRVYYCTLASHARNIYKKHEKHDGAYWLIIVLGYYAEAAAATWNEHSKVDIDFDFSLQTFA